MLDSKVFWDVLIVISSITELWVCKKVFDYTSEKKYSDMRINLIMSLIIILMLFLLKINVHPNIRIIVAVILTIVFYITSYTTSITTAIITTLIYWMVLLGSDALSMSISIWINSLNSMDMLLVNSSYRLQSIILGKSILILILGLYRRIKFEIELHKKDILYLGIPIITNIVSFFVIFKYVFKFSDMKLISTNEILYISILLFLSNISIILVIRKIRKDSRLLAQKDMVKNSLEMQYKYYMNIKENQDKVRQLHHDMKNHIICMRKLNQNGYDNEKYIESIDKRIRKYENTFDTGNVLLDIILSEKKQICNNKNIKFLSSLNFTKCDFIELEDICSIFSNILDNAIEACMKINSNNKYIYIEGKIVEKFFIMKVENSKINKINIKNNKFMTDKDNKFSHGLGISSIKNSVKKYNGETVINYTDDRFIIKILIPIILYND
nr:GHKL domain-containing protein [uncultured Romboutsia sp.]